MPISDCDVRDPRMKRTRQLLQGALRKLLQEKPLDEVGVQDITGEATVNRATFYDHYTDKFALLECMVGSDFHELLAAREVQFDRSCTSTLTATVLYPSQEVRDIVIQSGMEHGAAESYDKLASLLAGNGMTRESVAG